MNDNEIMHEIRPIVESKLSLIAWLEMNIKHTFSNFRDMKFKLWKKVFDIALNKMVDDSYTLKHAKEEFKHAGYTPIEESKNDPDKWIQENVLELLKVFSAQGHSGVSAPYAVEYFKKLALHEPLMPIQGTEDEWYKYQDDIDSYQNKRCGAIFKDEGNSKAHYLDAIIWRDGDKIAFTGTVYLKDGDNVVKYKSRQFIDFPFIPKSFYVDVYEENDEYYIKDKKQLDEALKYFSKDKKSNKKK